MWRQCHRTSLLQVLFPMLFFVIVVATLLAKFLLLLLHVVTLATCEYVISDELPLENFVLHNLLHAPSTGCSSSPVACQGVLEL